MGDQSGWKQCVDCQGDVRANPRSQGGGTPKQRCVSCEAKRKSQRVMARRKKWCEEHWGERPLCGCRCGDRVDGTKRQGVWSRYLHGHNPQPLGKGAIPVQKLDFSQERDAYILGMFLGDGTVNEGKKQNCFSIPVNQRDSDYCDALAGELRAFNLSPKVFVDKSGLFRIRVHRSLFAHQLAKYKLNGKWTLPVGVHLEGLLAGLVDTDGSVTSSGVYIYQKANGNLKLLCDLLSKAGYAHRLCIYHRVKWGKRFSEDRIVFGVEGSLKLPIQLRHPRKNMRLTELRNKRVG